MFYLSEGHRAKGKTMTQAPVPVGVEITDEAVKAAWVAAGHSTLHGDRVAQIRAALDAARPFMTSRPALDRDRVREVIVEARNLRGSHEVFVDAVMALAVPVPTREQIAEAIQRVYGGSLDVRKGSGAQQAADAVLALLNGSARP